MGPGVWETLGGLGSAGARGSQEQSSTSGWCRASFMGASVLEVCSLPWGPQEAQQVVVGVEPRCMRIFRVYSCVPLRLFLYLLLRLVELVQWLQSVSFHRQIWRLPCRHKRFRSSSLVEMRPPTSHRLVLSVPH